MRNILGDISLCDRARSGRRAALEIQRHARFPPRFHPLCDRTRTCCASASSRPRPGACRLISSMPACSTTARRSGGSPNSTPKPFSPPASRFDMLFGPAYKGIPLVAGGGHRAGRTRAQRALQPSTARKPRTTARAAHDRRAARRPGADHRRRDLRRHLGARIGRHHPRARRAALRRGHRARPHGARHGRAVGGAGSRKRLRHAGHQHRHARRPGRIISGRMPTCRQHLAAVTRYREQYGTGSLDSSRDASRPCGRRAARDRSHRCMGQRPAARRSTAGRTPRVRPSAATRCRPNPKGDVRELNKRGITVETEPPPADRRSSARRRRRRPRARRRSRSSCPAEARGPERCSTPTPANEIELKRKREVRLLESRITSLETNIRNANERQTDVQRRMDEFKRNNKPVPRGHDRRARRTSARSGSSTPTRSPRQAGDRGAEQGIRRHRWPLSRAQGHARAGHGRDARRRRQQPLPRRRRNSLGYCARRRRRISLTCCGLALPLVAFITWPTSALKAFSLPARNSSTDSGFAASTSSTIFSIAPASEICFRPRLLDDRRRRRPSPGPQRLEHFLGHLSRDRAVGDAARPARAAARRRPARSRCRVPPRLSARQVRPSSSWRTCLPRSLCRSSAQAATPSRR